MELALRHAAGVDQLPAQGAELHPAEHLWTLVDEPVVNRHFATIEELDAVLDKRCQTLSEDRSTIAAHTHFHWWPNPVTRN